jgi:diguanylate cyclase (GGDEF)-like protein
MMLTGNYLLCNSVPIITKGTLIVTEKASSPKNDPVSLFTAMNTMEEPLLTRLNYLEFGDKDAALLSALQTYLDGLGSEKRKQSPSQSADFSWLNGNYCGHEYLRNRISAGLVHQRIGLSPASYAGACRQYLAELIPTLWDMSNRDFSRFEALLGALIKVIFFDIGIAVDAYTSADRKAIAEKQQHEEQIFFQSTHDRPTGLPNHLLLKEHLQKLILQSQADKSTIIALIIVDIDHFKLKKDSSEHYGENLLLQGIAERLNGHISAHDGDLLSRYAHNQFALVLNDPDQSRNVTTPTIIEKILSCFSDPFLIQERALHVSCNIGIATYPDDSDEATTLSKYAGIALHYAKEKGQNHYQFFSADIHRRALDRLELENALYSAIANNELYLDYQPLADLQTGHLSGLEALIRWQHPVLGLLPPADFIPLAEESELIASIGEWVLRQACLDMRTWIDNGFSVPRVAINVSPRQFQDSRLADRVESILYEIGIAPSLICLEITETLLMQNTVSNEAILKQLKSLGVSLALDDFGTGYSSLSYLKRFPFDHVKIDQSFVCDIVTNTDDAAIAQAIVSMAHSLGIRVIAEGVETEAQCDFLRRHMCDEIQGFFYGRPLSPAKIAALLLEGKQLPDHLLRNQKPPRTLLLVDDETNILSSLKRLLRRDGYQILLANSGQEGLELLQNHDVDVIVSDQRMPGMTGVEFLRTAKKMYPDTVRIVLSGYTELQSVTDAVNEGAIYKFLTKPWEDQLLRGHIEEAFRHKEMADENQRLDLEVRTANQALAVANRQMEEVLKQKQQQIMRHEINLDIVREVLENVPLPLIGLDEDEAVAFVNSSAQHLLMNFGMILGNNISTVLPQLSDALARYAISPRELCLVELDGMVFQIISHPMGQQSKSRGKLITLTKYEKKS